MQYKLPLALWCGVRILLERLTSAYLWGRLRLKCDGTRAETIFRLSAKWTSPFKSAGVSVQSTTGSRGVRFSGSNAGYTILRGSVKSIGYSLHSPVSPSLPLPNVTVCHHISTGLYTQHCTECTSIHRPLQYLKNIRQVFLGDSSPLCSE